MHSLEPSRPADFRERFLPTQTTVSGNTGPKRTTSLPSISPAPPQPPSATVVAGNFHETGRVRQFFRKFVGARSPSFLNQIDRAPGARQKCKRRPLRDRSSSDHLGDSAEFSAEV
ncbi:DNAse I-like superfamily protein [Prunus dulcis]|uniref:DNAse I-like superfamily protein n=1 Tax=Prunus dulcis TaxID=3755 RepID=A0A5H2XHK6_PRUDU|nr:DNAse I-like superfamily protein [Prunus dulcis]